ncbi:3-carboxy-cis,cis-muconate cycloisomerase [Rhizomonospora bruguierae]|uniref:3-carboxy-cis,cis-muconate cycloisomerase n=1 Tax=Rhizomonospora bruguierae TaxID=1581705 RepID=UPI001BCDB90B|nr:3-carboxy-cis,cis-muconate cycloisomerase [Micromonospora sp. NBRC 107566]
MKPSSSPSDGGLFDGVLAAGPVRVEVSDAAWLRALLDAEAALARAQARVGLVEAADADAVVAACARLTVDPGDVGAQATGAGNPVVPLVARLRAALPPATAQAVHRGATSQDIMDSAAMLVAHRARVPLLADLSAAADRAAALAATHRHTPVAGRTLLQQALPTTFGLVAAGWLTGLDAARRRLAAVPLAGQLGGGAGTLAAFGDAGLDLLAAYCAELGLVEPVVPWHTERGRVADLAGALGATAGALAKVARDVVLYAQTEVGEVAEAGPGGGSSTLPHKRNPIRAVSAAACAAQAPGLVATLLAAMPQEHQRAAGGWHAEWRPLRALIESTGSAAHWLRASLDALEVDAARMRANLDLTGGDLLAERVSAALRPVLGAGAAHEVVRSASGNLAGDPRITAHLSPGELVRLLDPATYLGSAGELIDRALRAAGR